MEDLSAVILLGGGASSRFAPFQEKNLFSFLGKSLVEHQVARYKKKGLGKIIVVTNQENFSQIKKIARKEDKKIEVVIQRGEGMAGAVLTGLSFLKESQPVLIANMNDLFDESFFENFSKTLKQKGKINLLIGYYCPSYFPGGYLILKGKRVLGVIEKPGEGKEPSKYIKLVFDYFPEAKKLAFFLKNAKSSKDDVYEVALSNMMAKKEVFLMLEHRGVWQTLKYPWHILGVQEYFLTTIKRNIAKDVQIAAGAKIIGPVILEKGVRVFENAIVRGPAFIGSGTIVGNGVLIRESLIGTNCVVGYNTEIARSYVGEGCWFHSNYIGDSVLGNNISFGAGAITANLRLDEQEIKVEVKGEKINTGRKKLGSIIGDNVRIGINVCLCPGEKLAKVVLLVRE